MNQAGDDTGEWSARPRTVMTLAACSEFGHLVSQPQRAGRIFVRFESGDGLRLLSSEDSQHPLGNSSVFEQPQRQVIFIARLFYCLFYFI